MLIPRISNPKKFVKVIFEDMGDIRPIYDKNGNAIEGYTSVFEWDGKKVKSTVSRDEAHYSTNPSEYRFLQDCAFLKKYDLDLAKAKF